MSNTVYNSENNAILVNGNAIGGFPIGESIIYSPVGINYGVMTIRLNEASKWNTFMQSMAVAQWRFSRPGIGGQVALIRVSAMLKQTPVFANITIKKDGLSDIFTSQICVLNGMVPFAVGQRLGVNEWEFLCAGVTQVHLGAI